MSEGSGTPGQKPPGGGKRPAIGLQIKLPCATVEEVKARYGEDLRDNKFFIRTKSARPKDTLVRLEALLNTGAPAFKAAAVVIETSESGMRLSLLGTDEAGRELISALGGKPPPPLKADVSRPQPALPRSKPAITEIPGIKPPPPNPDRPTTGPTTPSKPVVAPLEKVVDSKPPPSAPTVPVPNPVPVAAAEPPKEAPPPAPEPKKEEPPRAEPEPAKEEPPKKKTPMIGIDLGTTNSAAAVVRDGKPFVIPSREGYNTIPSIVALNEKGKVIVGHPAKGQLLINPKNTVYGAKRLVGRQFASQVVTDLIGRFPYQIVAGPRGEAAVQLGDRQFSLQQISALVLTEVKEIAQQWLQAPVERAVITVPAYYNDNQRLAVREAGELAGLKVERILNEPTAAAVAFAHGRHLEQRVMVYDLGGGTFDASVLELHGNVYEVISTGGDTFLGGVDFDKVIVDHLLAAFKETHGIDFPGDRVALQRVTDAAERAKIALSEQLEYKVKVPFVALVGDKPYDLEASISRSELVLLTGHLVDRSLRVCDEVLAAANLKPQDIAEVLLVGGQSRMPLVRERIRNYFGKEPSKAVHPDEAVALGAALLAHTMDSGDIQGVVLVDVLPMSIGVGLPGGRFKKLIERNTSLPHKRSLNIATTRDDQPSLEVTVFQGESEKAQENEYLGTLLIPDLPRGPRGSVSFEVVFSVTAESILTVNAEDKKTGRAVTWTFSTRDTPEEVRNRLAESPVTDTRDQPPVKVGGQRGGFVGWLKRLFGRPQPRA
ncbi:MAG TPA: Hsp70 family protein [Myxococcales bacterium]|nr:Hsp70 family protein [Myxococcales bacterium]